MSLYKSFTYLFTYLLVCQTGQTPLSIADRLGFTAAAELLRTVTSRLPPGATPDAALLMVEPETMIDVDSEDDTGKRSDSYTAQLTR